LTSNFFLLALIEADCVDLGKHFKTYGAKHCMSCNCSLVRVEYYWIAKAGASMEAETVMGCILAAISNSFAFQAVKAASD
jgi:hypothetical protein